IVGKFDAAAMTATVTELFGAWSGDPPPPLAPTPAMRPVAGPRFLAHTDPDAEQVRITVAFATTSPRSAARGARTVLTEMLRGRPSDAGAAFAAAGITGWVPVGDGAPAPADPTPRDTASRIRRTPAR